MTHMEATQYHRHPHRRKTVIMVCGDKGGVGKSFMSRVIAGWLIANGYKVHGFDGDARNAHLERYYSLVMPVKRPPLRSTNGWTDMFNAWASKVPEDFILVDLPGGAGDMVTEQAERFKLVVDRLEIDVILVWVASDGEDSIWLLKPAQCLAPVSRTLFTMNGYFGKSADGFRLWNQSKSRAKFLEAGGEETLLPVLGEGPLDAITRTRCPFSDTGPANFTLLDNIDFDMWWADVDRVLTPFKNMLERD